MSDHHESIGDCGLHCFGSISASVTHELKNALAIINENAGLMEDLSFMAEKGRPLDPARLKSLAANIIRQIQRADTIILNLNRFAHSADEAHKTIDLGDTLSLMVALSSRLAAMKSIVLDFVPNSQSVCVTTRLFYFLNLIWLCIKEIFERSGEKKISLSLRKLTDGAAAIVFSPIDALLTFPDTLSLLNHLNAGQSINIQQRELIITLPADLTAC